MATIRKFTEIKAWQVGRELAKSIYALTGAGPFAKDYGFRDQIQRAVVSINSNIAEGFERDSNAEFAKFLGYAKGSAGEVLSQLITAHDIGYVADEKHDELVAVLKRLSVMIARLRDKIIASDMQGLRWRFRAVPSPAAQEPRNLGTQKPRNIETQKPC